MILELQAAGVPARVDLELGRRPPTAVEPIPIKQGFLFSNPDGWGLQPPSSVCLTCGCTGYSLGLQIQFVFRAGALLGPK